LQRESWISSSGAPGPCRCSLATWKAPPWHTTANPSI
jgi:hypothetical protein